MNDKYTPTTEEIRDRAIRSGAYPQFASPTLRSDFDRWLAAHDAEVLAAERERIIEDMQDCSHPDDWGVPCVYVANYAKRMRGEAGHEGDS